MNIMNLPGVPSALCTLCDENAEDNSEHALLTCSYIRVRAENLLQALQHKDPTMTFDRIKSLYPLTFLTASILEQLWTSKWRRKDVYGPLYAPSVVTSPASEKRKVGPVCR